MKEDAEEKEREEAQRQEYLALNRSSSTQSTSSLSTSDTTTSAVCGDIMQFCRGNKWHQTIKGALLRCRLKDDITIDQMRAINYFHSVHEAVVNFESVNQIE